jgi:hypothetical protein
VRRARFFAGAFALCVVASTAPALAQETSEKVACARSYEQGQRLRRSQELRAAREELVSCSRAECPASLRKECTQWLSEVELAIPSVLVSAKSSDGKPAKDVHIRIDGEPVSEQATRSPIPLDPGVHVVRFESPGAAEIEERVTLRSGEKSRRIEVTFAAAAKRPPDDGIVGPPQTGPEQPTTEKPIPPLVYVLAGTAVVALGVGGYFQISGMGKRDDLYQCAPRCPQDDVDHAKTSLWIGNVTLGVGVLALAAATYFYLVRP